MNPNKKYFNVLGITPTTDKSVIKKAYRKLAFQYHPDKNSSPQAQSKFIEITDAYEIVTGVKKVPNRNTESTEPTKEERVKAAKERYQKAKQKELEEEAAFYFKMIEGNKWKFIKLFGIACAILSAFLFLDYFLPSTVSTKLISELYIDNTYNHLYISLESSNYYFNYKEAIQVAQYPLVEVTKTPIFNDLKYIGFIGRDGEYTMVEPIFSILFIFPIIPIILLIPLFTRWYKRPNALFTILHMVSIYFVPIVFCFALFSNWRIFQVFM